MENITSEKFASAIARFLDDNKAKDIVILNVANVCSLSDYFIIATGSSTPHVRALTENIRKKIKDVFSRLPMGEESERMSKWNLLDYGEVVIHIMNQEQRDTYKIEKFWSHALTLDREIWEENSKEFAQYE
ncbi:MAG: ribosome silencing factor [Candidatus Gastranaerophilales bacterium]|nr:ribosome silencing factor [Candidatus Gastranaerophilales bacterium]